jgi:hypothetical protein
MKVICMGSLHRHASAPHLAYSACFAKFGIDGDSVSLSWMLCMWNPIKATNGP